MLRRDPSCGGLVGLLIAGLSVWPRDALFHPESGRVLLQAERFTLSVERYGLSDCCHGRPIRSPPSHRRATLEWGSEVFHSNPSWSNDYSANSRGTEQLSAYSRAEGKSTLQYRSSLSPEGLIFIGHLVEIRNLSRRFRAWDMLPAKTSPRNQVTQLTADDLRRMKRATATHDFLPSLCHDEEVNNGRPQSTGPERPANLEAGILSVTGATPATATHSLRKGTTSVSMSHDGERKLT